MIIIAKKKKVVCWKYSYDYYQTFKNELNFVIK